MKLPCLFCGAQLDGPGELLAHGENCPAMKDRQKGAKKSVSSGTETFTFKPERSEFFADPIDELLASEVAKEMATNTRRMLDRDMYEALSYGMLSPPRRRQAAPKKRTVEDLGPYIREVCGRLVDKLEKDGSITIPRQMDTARDLILVLEDRGVKFNVDEEGSTLTFNFVNGC